MINIDWYRSFIAVYRLGTTTAAARSLHLTQPAVSQHIAALEKGIGVPLFARTGRHMEKLDAAKRLYTQIADALDQLEAAAGRAGIDRGSPPHGIRLGAPAEYFTERLLPHVEIEPPFSLEVRFGLAASLINRLADGDLDIVVSTLKMTRGDLDFHHLDREEFWLVAPPSLEIEVVESALRTTPWIAYDVDLPIIRRFWRQVFGHRLRVQPRFVLPDLRTVRAAVVAGCGISVLPDYLCGEAIRAGSMRLLISPDPPVTNDLWLACRKTASQTVAVQALLKTAEKLRPASFPRTGLA